MQNCGAKVGYINNFFDSLEIYEDNDKTVKKNFKEKILSFLENQNEEEALEIYKLFFESYWIGIQENENPFIELIKKMKSYETSGGFLLKNQRDHFTHSVNVFILGLIFYQNSNKFKDQFYRYVESSGYQNLYSTNNEEFFYRWGIASLSHDLAYPIEISLNQLKSYAGFLDSYSISDDNFNIVLSFKNFDKFDSLPLLTIGSKYEKEFKEKNPNLNLCDYTSCLKVLSKKTSEQFEVSQEKIMRNLKQKISDMENGVYIDHGFYSSVVVLKWYHSLISKTNWDPSYFIYPIVDAATAILNHNYFPKCLIREPFSCSKLKYETSPISFMLILCDELQEWNRINYFTKNTNVKGFDIKFYDNQCDLKYFSDDIDLLSKTEKINSILFIEEMFEINIEIEEVIK